MRILFLLKISNYIVYILKLSYISSNCKYFCECICKYIEIKLYNILNFHTNKKEIFKDIV